MFSYLRIELPELLVGQRALPGRDAPRRQEVAQVLVKQVERVDAAQLPELLLHPGARDVLLQLLDEPRTQEGTETNGMNDWLFGNMEMQQFQPKTDYSLGHDDQLDVSHGRLEQIR